MPYTNPTTVQISDCPLCQGRMAAFSVGGYGMLKCTGKDGERACGLRVERAVSWEDLVKEWNGVFGE